MTSTVNVNDGFVTSCGSDRIAWTVIEARTAKTIVVQRDKAGERLPPLDAPMGRQAAIRDTEGQTRTYTLRKNGCWHEKGEPMNWWAAGNVVQAGTQTHYRDPHF